MRQNVLKMAEMDFKTASSTMEALARISVSISLFTSRLVWLGWHGSCSPHIITLQPVLLKMETTWLRVPSPSGGRIIATRLRALCARRCQSFETQNNAEGPVLIKYSISAVENGHRGPNMSPLMYHQTWRGLSAWSFDRYQRFKRYKPKTFGVKTEIVSFYRMMVVSMETGCRGGWC